MEVFHAHIKKIETISSCASSSLVRRSFHPTTSGDGEKEFAKYRTTMQRHPAKCDPVKSLALSSDGHATTLSMSVREPARYSRWSERHE